MMLDPCPRCARREPLYLAQLPGYVEVGPGLCAGCWGQVARQAEYNADVARRALAGAGVAR